MRLLARTSNASTLPALVTILASLLTADPARALDKSSARDGLVRLPSAGGTVSAEGSTFLTQSNTGAATYSVALPELPGRAGVSAKLSLAYNPMNGDVASGFGSGWRLDIPSIDITYDYGIPWPGGMADNENIYRLRGQRLVVDPSTLQSTDASKPIIYYLQATDPAIKVRYHRTPFKVDWANPVPGDDGTPQSVPSIASGFEVVYPDGKVELYSGDLSQAEGALLRSGESLITRFPLVFEIQRHGEWIRYSYVKASENSYLREVAFASGQSKYTFELTPSASNVHTYAYGFRQSNGLLATQMTASFGGQVRSRWCFAYAGPSGASSGGVITAPACRATLQEEPLSVDELPVHDRLASIRRFGNSPVLAPTTVHEPAMHFEYSSLSAADLKSRPLVYSAPGLTVPLRSTDVDGLELLDVNDDALPDVVQSPSAGRALPEVYFGALDQARSFNTHAPLTLSRPGRQIAMNLSQSTFQIADVNGDGFEDVLEFDAGVVHVYGGGHDNASANPYVWKADYSLSGFNADTFVGGAGMFVDLNQDGLTDILTTTPFSGAGTNTGQQWTVFINHTSADWKIGFDRVDYSLPRTISQSKFLTDEKQFDIIDINGDTLPDFVWTNGPQGWMCVYENTGAFYQTPAFRTLLFGNAALNDPDCGHGVKVTLAIPAVARAFDTWMLDVNGDGILDVVTIGQTFQQLHVWYGLADLTFSDALDPNGIALNDAVHPEAGRSRTSDLTGDGHDDIVIFQTVNGVRSAVIIDFYRTATTQLIKPGLLTGVEIESGERYDIRYATSASEMTRDLHAGLDTRFLQFPAIVAKQVVRSTGARGSARSSVDVTEFYYHDPYYDPITREFRGFGTIGQLAYGDEGFPSYSQDSAYREETFLTTDPDPLRRLLSGRRLSKKTYGVQADAAFLQKLLDSNTFDPKDVVLHSLATSTSTQPLPRAGDLLEETTSSWDSIEQVTGLGACFGWLASTRTVQHGASGALKTTTRSYTRDAFNVPTKEREETTWSGVPFGLAAPRTVKTTTWTYDRTARAFEAIALPSSETVTMSTGGPDVAIGASATEYDARGLVYRLRKSIYGGAVPDDVLTLAAGSDAALLAGLRAHSLPVREEITLFDHDAFGNVIARSDGIGLVEQSSYDATGVLRVESRTVKLEDRALDQVTAMTYDAAGRLASTTDPLGLTSAYEYDELGRLSARRDSDGGEETYQYRSSIAGSPSMVLTTTRSWPNGGAPASETEWVQRLTAYAPDGAKLADAEDAESGVRIVGYQARNRRRSNVTAFAPYGASQIAGQAASSVGDLFAIGDVPPPSAANSPAPVAFRFDALERLARRVLPNGRESVKQYEPWGELVTETYATARGTRSRQTYDIATSLGRIAKIEAADGQQVITRFGRDEAGNLTSIQLDGQSPRALAYDTAGRIVSHSVPGMGATYSLRDDRGRIVASIQVPTTGPAILVETTYDSLDRPIFRAENGEPTRELLYDLPSTSHHPRAGEVAKPIGKLTLARAFDGNHVHDYEEALAYDARGHVVRRSVDLGRSFEETFVYALDGKVRAVVTPRGLREDYARNRASQVSAIHVSGASLGEPETMVSHAGYDERGQLASIAYGNGGRTTLDYDPRSLVVRQVDTTFKDASGADRPLVALSYDVDGDDTIASIRDGLGGSAFGAVDRSATFEHDGRGQLTKSTRYGQTLTYGYDAAGVVLALDPSAFAYDGLGRLVRSPELADAHYDDDGRLVRAVLKTGDEVRYGYTPDGRRIYRSVASSDGTVTSESLYPTRSYEEEPGASQSLIFLGGARIARFEHGASGAADRWFYVLHDPAGSTELVTGADGTPVEQTVYSPYGTEVDAAALAPAWAAHVSANASQLPLEQTHRRFMGQYADTATGLFDFGGRPYSPQLGRFATPDPRFVADPIRCEEDTLGCGFYALAHGDPSLLDEASSPSAIALSANGTVARVVSATLRRILVPYSNESGPRPSKLVINTVDWLD